MTMPERLDPQTGGAKKKERATSGAALGMRRFAGRAALALSFLVATSLFYRSALDHYFYFDDFVFLERSTISSPSDLIEFFSVELNQRGLLDKNHSYRPISTNLFFGLGQLAFGFNPKAFHLLNLLTLAANAMLVALLLCRLGVRTGTGVAFALVYALSSVNFESQLWISVIQELSASFFLLMALLVYVCPEVRGRARTFGSVGLYVIALLCKEMAVTLPALLLLWELVVERTTVRGAVHATAPFWFVSAIYVTLYSIFFDIPEAGPYAVLIGGFVLENLARYARWSAEALFLTSDWRALLLLVAISIAAFLVAPSRVRRSVVLGLLWFLIALGPVIFLPNHSYDYYLVIPFIGLVIAAATLADSLFSFLPRKKLRISADLLLVVGFALVSYPRFAERELAREHQTSSFRAAIGQLRASYPELPDGTSLYFSADPGFPLGQFLKDSGAIFRVVYRNPTLHARPTTPQILRSASRRDATGRLVFRINSDGSLKEHPGNRAALLDGRDTQSVQPDPAKGDGG